MALASPPEWGLPERFDSWRPGQAEAIERSLACTNRYCAESAPTGTGKSLLYMATALLTGYRTVILTATKGLQRQLAEDFKELGLVSIMGKKNYPCSMRPGMTCDEGQTMGCPMKRKVQCPRQRAYIKMRMARFIVTNYSYWIAENTYGHGFGDVEMLVLDEAHSAHNEIAQALQIYLSRKDVEEGFRVKFPPESASMYTWKSWAHEILPRVDLQVEYLKERIGRSGEAMVSWLRDYNHTKRLRDKIRTVASCRPEGWVISPRGEYGFELDMVDLSAHGESVLFRGVPRVRFYSATVRPKTLTMLGVKEGEFEFHEHPTTFPPSALSVWWVPTLRVDRSVKPSDMGPWVTRCDQIIGRRLDRKGIVHTVSYDRQRLLTQRSAHSHLMVYNSRGDVTSEVVSEFKATAPPCLLVSPSVGTGYDFIDEQARYQIVGKVPFPDSRRPVYRAREALDKEYGAYCAMQDLVQMCGRSTRSPFDRSEVFVIDDHISWAIRKHRDFAPNWFWNFWRGKSEVIPPPMEI